LQKEVNLAKTQEREVLLKNINNLNGHNVYATDGAIGKVDDFYFEDVAWTVRYMVVDIGSWLSGRKVLIPPIALEKPAWDQKAFPISFTREQVERSPEIDLPHEPISRKYERELYAHYEWPMYWEYGNVDDEAKALEEGGESHLRSVNEVTGYRVNAVEGQIGSLLDFIVDTEEWIIRYLVSSTRYIIEHPRDLLQGKKVLIPPDWTKVSWAESEIQVDLPIQIVKDGPEYDPDTPLNRDFEEIIYDYYRRPKYWTKD
jgi:hypothetical protein